MVIRAGKVASVALTLAGGLLIAFAAYLWAVVGSDALTPVVMFGGVAGLLLLGAKAIAR